MASSSRFHVRPLAEELQAKYSAGALKLVEVRYDGVAGGRENKYIPVREFFVDNLAIYKDFKVRDSDIWVITYPKSGTTFGTEMIWLLCSDLDYATASKTDLINRLCHLEWVDDCDRWRERIMIYLEINFRCPCTQSRIKEFLIAEEAKVGQRVIRSHLPLSLLPAGLFESKAKIVYITRNPMDTAISLYHHNMHYNRSQTTLEESLSGFLTGQMHYGSYFDHVSEFRELSDRLDNMILVTFEEMKYSMSKVLHKLCKFFEKSYSEDQLGRLEAHLHFDQMKKNPSVNFEELRKTIAIKYNDENVGQ